MSSRTKGLGQAIKAKAAQDAKSVGSVRSVKDIENLKRGKPSDSNTNRSRSLLKKPQDSLKPDGPGQSVSQVLDVPLNLSTEMSNEMSNEMSLDKSPQLYKSQLDLPGVSKKSLSQVTSRDEMSRVGATGSRVLDLPDDSTPDLQTQQELVKGSSIDLGTGDRQAQIENHEGAGLSQDVVVGQTSTDQVLGNYVEVKPGVSLQGQQQGQTQRQVHGQMHGQMQGQMQGQDRYAMGVQGYGYGSFAYPMAFQGYPMHMQMQAQGIQDLQNVYGMQGLQNMQNIQGVMDSQDIKHMQDLQGTHNPHSSQNSTNPHKQNSNPQIDATTDSQYTTTHRPDLAPGPFPTHLQNMAPAYMPYYPYPYGYAMPGYPIYAHAPNGYYDQSMPLTQSMPHTQSVPHTQAAWLQNRQSSLPTAIQSETASATYTTAHDAMHNGGSSALDGSAIGPNGSIAGYTNHNAGPYGYMNQGLTSPINPYSGIPYERYPISNGQAHSWHEQEYIERERSPEPDIQFTKEEFICPQFNFDDCLLTSELQPLLNDWQTAVAYVTLRLFFQEDFTSICDDFMAFINLFQQPVAIFQILELPLDLIYRELKLAKRKSTTIPDLIAEIREHPDFEDIQIPPAYTPTALIEILRHILDLSLTTNVVRQTIHNAYNIGPKRKTIREPAQNPYMLIPIGEESSPDSIIKTRYWSLDHSFAIFASGNPYRTECPWSLRTWTREQVVDLRRDLDYKFHKVDVELKARTATHGRCLRYMERIKSLQSTKNRLSSLIQAISVILSRTTEVSDGPALNVESGAEPLTAQKKEEHTTHAVISPSHVSSDLPKTTTLIEVLDITEDPTNVSGNDDDVVVKEEPVLKKPKVDETQNHAPQLNKHKASRPRKSRS